MPRTADTPVPFSRLLELAEQADRQQRARITAFLTPPEAELAIAAGKRARVNGSLSGGYEGAERQMARFSPDGEPDGHSPLRQSRSPGRISRRPATGTCWAA